MQEFHVIFDNGGGISVQTDEEYYFFGDNHYSAAQSVATLLNGETTDHWEGNEPEHRIAYDAEQVRNGGYQWWDAEDLRETLRGGTTDSGWRNVRSFLDFLAEQ